MSEISKAFIDHWNELDDAVRGMTGADLSDVEASDESTPGGFGEGPDLYAVPAVARDAIVTLAQNCMQPLFPPLLWATVAADVGTCIGQAFDSQVYVSKQQGEPLEDIECTCAGRDNAALRDAATELLRQWARVRKWKIRDGKDT